MCSYGKLWALCHDKIRLQHNFHSRVDIINYSECLKRSAYSTVYLILIISVYIVKRLYHKYPHSRMLSACDEKYDLF